MDSSPDTQGTNQPEMKSSPEIYNSNAALWDSQLPTSL